jgi:tetratricopeptide (TPR) repeat protein
MSMEQSVEYYKDQLEQINNLCDEGMIDQALEASERLRKESSGNGDSGFELFFAGESEALQGNLGKGARLQFQAVKKMPDIAFVAGNCAVLMSMSGKPVQALRLLDMVLEQEPENLQALGQKGVCLAKTGYDQEARICFERILELDPGQHHAMRNLAVSLSRLGREQEALDIFDRVLRENPADSHARSEKAILLDEMGLVGTPLGWLLLWFRKRFVPYFLRMRYRAVQAG